LHESTEIETIVTQGLCTPTGKFSFLGFCITKEYLTAPIINTHTHTTNLAWKPSICPLNRGTIYK